MDWSNMMSKTSSPVCPNFEFLSRFSSAVERYCYFISKWTAYWFPIPSLHKEMQHFCLLLFIIILFVIIFRTKSMLRHLKFVTSTPTVCFVAQKCVLFIDYDTKIGEIEVLCELLWDTWLDEPQGKKYWEGSSTSAPQSRHLCSQFAIFCPNFVHNSEFLFFRQKC